MSRFILLPLFCLCFLPIVAHAGMPTVTISLTEMAEVRLQNISFFLFAFFLSAFLIRLLWNYLHTQFPKLPHLSYKMALGVTLLWGLIFVLVLTMISGARELMTPAAWERDGRTYKVVKDKSPTDAPAAIDDERKRKLEDLRFALWDQAQMNNGAFPQSRDSGDVPADLWRVPHPTGMRYLFTGGLQRKGPVKPLAWEPELWEGGRYVLFTNGAVRKMSNEEIEEAVSR
jgi:hypothetical protein